MRRFLIGLVLVLFVLPVAAQDLPYVVVRVKMPSGLKAERVPVLSTLKLADVRESLKGRALPAAGLVKASEGAAVVPAQFDVLDEATGRVCLMLPTKPAGQRQVRLYMTKAEAAGAGNTVRVEQAGDVVTVDTGAAAVTFDPTKNGGLPSRIVFGQGGKTWDTPVFNDRLYDPEIKGFQLKDDKQASVRVTARGPLYTEVQVTARYMQGDKPAPSGASATYTFGFPVGSPTFRVSGDIRQKAAFSWQQLHFLELWFQDNTFPEWAAGPPGTRQAFKDDSKGGQGSRWAALLDGQNAIGFLTNARIYDGNSNYGRYLHGPWLPWSDTQARHAVDVWAGTASDPVAAISAAADSGARVLEGTMLTAELLAALEKLRKTGARQAWVASLIEKAATEGQLSLRDAEKLTRSKLLTGTTLPMGKRTLYLLSTKQLGIAVTTGDNAQLVSMFDLQRQRETLAAPCDLFQMALMGADGKRAGLSSTSGWQRFSWRMLKENTAMTMSYAMAPDPALEGLSVGLEVRLEGGLSYWKIEVGNKSTEWSLDSVTLPSLKVAALGDDAGDDVLLYPNGYGRGYPVTSTMSQGATYPSGSCAMQWIGVCDQASGVYVGQHDATASTKVLQGTCAGDGGYSTLRIEVPAENATVPGNSFKTEGEVVIGVTGGGWWPMTRIYRSFLEKSAPWWPEPKSYSRSDYPKWMQETQTWACTGGTAQAAVPTTKAFAEAMGTPTALHWYSWHVIPFDNQYPHYFPTKEGFRDGVADLQKAGVRVMPYINGRLWDEDTDDFRSEAVKYATKKPNGEWYVEVYGSKRRLVPMCTHPPYWQDKVNEIVMKLVREEGVDAVYIDQVSAAKAVLCYDKSHGHPLAGGHWWVDGYWKMLDKMQRDIAKVHPDKALTTESNAEPFVKWFDAYLMCNSNADYELPLFPAVYGGKILMFGTYMNKADWDDLTLMALRQGKLFAFGTQLWWSDPGIVKNEQATQWLRDVARLRQQLNEFFVHGQMAAPPQFVEKIPTMSSGWRQWTASAVELHTPELWATTWRLENGQLLIPLVNLPKEERTYTLRFDPAAYGLKANAKVKVERLTANGVTETVAKQGRFNLPVKLGAAEVTALRITGQ
ncbi:MAG: DUF6259 domain-containing protein [Armatimonadota bacterium]